MAEDVVVTIVHKESDKEEKNVDLNLNLDKVTVKSRNAYVELPDEVDCGNPDFSLVGAQIENAGEGNLRLTLEGGETLQFDAEDVISALIKAVDLPAIEEE